MTELTEGPPGGAFLSNGQWEYLVDSSDLSDNQKRQYRYQIRSKIRNSMADLEAFEYISAKDLVMAFEPLYHSQRSSGNYNTDIFDLPEIDEIQANNEQLSEEDRLEKELEGIAMHSGIESFLSQYVRVRDLPGFASDIAYSIVLANIRQDAEELKEPSPPPEVNIKISIDGEEKIDLSVP